MSSLAATGALATFGAFYMQRLGGSLVDTLSHFGNTPLRAIQADELRSLALSGGMSVALLVGPIALAAAGAGLLTSFGQGGISFSWTPLQPNFSKLSPANGLKRFTPMRTGIDTLKTLLAAIVLGILAWRVGRELAGNADGYVWTGATGSAMHGWTAIRRLLWQSGFALLALGAIDYIVQRWRFMSSLKMSRQELKDEARSSEGSPEIKARVRRIQRDMSRRRMLSATKRATVVLVNPTHYAVALEYNREKSAAPIVVAKGKDLLAAKIREVAREHSIPIIENPPLTRAIFQGAEVGDMIPAPLFGAVAEILAYLIRIKQLML